MQTVYAPSPGGIPAGIFRGNCHVDPKNPYENVRAEFSRKSGSRGTNSCILVAAHIAPKARSEQLMWGRTGGQPLGRRRGVPHSPCLTHCQADRTTWICWRHSVAQKMEPTQRRPSRTIEPHPSTKSPGAFLAIHLISSLQTAWVWIFAMHILATEKSNLSDYNKDLYLKHTHPTPHFDTVIIKAKIYPNLISKCWNSAVILWGV